MKQDTFEIFFDGEARRHLYDAVTLALREDGEDLTSNAVFGPEDTLTAEIRAKGDAVIVGLPLIPIILQEAVAEKDSLPATVTLHRKDGDLARPGDVIVSITGGARRILKAERVILNFICHLSGIATLTAAYVRELSGSGIRMLDTRKTLPGLRYPEKYAVLMGGATNHRRNLCEMLMLKDNHIDAAGSITKAVACLRDAYGDDCPPIEVECRSLAEVTEAVACAVSRIMLDNMPQDDMQQALGMIPPDIETEISGGVTFESLHSLAAMPGRKPTFISAGRLTHSAPAADFSMRISLPGEENQ